ncbi:hypothetical protein TWF694_006614 [Orbilia ellipsospora]|uniref:Uncharacterized protein n=1 Tax=Orbilia ellipsospora TaxID=2528407 RepID=A0AAV9XLJ9_9PEZI
MDEGDEEFMKPLLGLTLPFGRGCETGQQYYSHNIEACLEELKRVLEQLKNMGNLLGIL